MPSTTFETYMSSGYSSDEEVYIPIVGSAVNIGGRETQQDRVLKHLTHLSSINPMTLAAVFDGHGTKELGHVVSDACSQKLVHYLKICGVWASLESNNSNDIEECLDDAVMKLESDALDLNEAFETYAGSTVCGVLASTELLVSFNVGDSRAVMGTKGPGNSVRAVDLTYDHVPSREEEAERVLENGGWIKDGAVNGYITMTRALGDVDLKKHRNITNFPEKVEGQKFGPELLVADPEISFFTRNASQKFVIVASDGIWSRISSDAAVKIIDGSLSKHGDADKASSTLIQKAISAGSTDNCSVIVILLTKEYNKKKRRKGVRSKIKSQFKSKSKTTK